MPQIVFSWYDYALFTVMLGVSTVIGIYFACFGQKQSTANEYLLGGKSMKVFPIAMSLIASQISAIALLGVPVDVYKFGSNFTMMVFGVVILSMLPGYVFMPVFHKLEITSTYEYLQLRFNSKIRILSSVMYTISMMLYLPIVIYGPALAFSQVTSFNLHLINPFISAICIIYTTIGGLKAVVWTDTLQFTTMIGAILAVLYLGVSAVGGIGTVWRRSLEGKRLQIDFDVDPTKRDTFWAILIGWTTYFVPNFGITQGSVQKFLSLPTIADVKKSAIIYGVGVVICVEGSAFIGLSIYAKYFDCDPFLAKRVTRDDQLLPYYVMDVASKIPGLPGLFIAGIFCAALSTLSAAMNSLSGTIYEDFIAKHMPNNITQKKVSNILKLIVLIIGVVSTSLVFVVEHLGGVLPLSIAFMSITSGPMLGLFILGMAFPSANSKGALFGSITSLAVVSWIVIGAQFYTTRGLIKYTPKPLSTYGCFINSSFSEIENLGNSDDGVFILYKISHYYYTLIGVVIVLIIGLLVSWYTGNNDSPVDRNLITPLMHWMLPKDVPGHQAMYQSLDKAVHTLGGNPNAE